MTNPVNVDQMIFNRGDWRRRLAASDRDLAERLAAAYQRNIVGIQVEMRKLVAKLRELPARDDGTLSPEAVTVVRDLDEYQAWLARMNSEMRDFSAILRNSMIEVSDDAIAVGVDSAQTMTLATAGRGEALVANAWVRPNLDAIRANVDYMDGSQMAYRINNFAPNAVREAQDLVIGLVAQGVNPRRIASELNRQLMTPLGWSMNMARTVQIWSYRSGVHQTYRANDHILEGWVWMSARDVRTCISCWGKDGTVHSVNEVLNDHHQGRCTPAPIVKGARWHFERRKGREVFNELDERDQEFIMGGAMFRAWRAGEVNFDQFSQKYDDGVYGEMLRASSLSSILGDGARVFYARG